MEHRSLGASGFKVPVLCLGTGTFARTGTPALGNVDGADARRIVDVCIDAGLTMFDSADSYYDGVAEEILGAAIKGRRDEVIISTKATHRNGPGPNDLGSSRAHLLDSIDAALKRLGTDYIDVYQMHGFDALTPIEETLSTLDGLVRAGKVRYIGCSNFSGWTLMKSLAAADRRGWSRYVVQQVYYSLLGRDFEWELMPLGIDQGVGAAVWSPLGWGRLTGRIRRGEDLPADSRLRFTAHMGPPVDDEQLFDIVDVLAAIAEETDKSIPQVALNWLLQRPTVATVIIGARTEEQLQENLGAVGWNLTADHVARLDAVSFRVPSYPYWHQHMDPTERIPSPVGNWIGSLET